MEYWLIPCNVKFFDVSKRFELYDDVVWKKDSKVKVGDVVYLYLGAPIGQIKYKCSVVREQITEDILECNTYAIRAGNRNKDNVARYMQLKFEKEYRDGILTYQELKKHGLGQVQKQARTSRVLQAYINDIEMVEG